MYNFYHAFYRNTHHGTPYSNPYARCENSANAGLHCAFGLGVRQNAHPHGATCPPAAQQCWSHKPVHANHEQTCAEKVTFSCNKLVRPGALESMKQQGMTPCAHPLHAQERLYYMMKKLSEEAREALEALHSGDHAHMWQELAHTYEALENVLASLHKTWHDIAHASHQAQEKEGSYAQGAVLRSITLDAHHPKVEKYKMCADYALQKNCALQDKS